MARAADIRRATLLKRLIRPDIGPLIVDLAVGGLDFLTENVVQLLGSEVSLFFCDPFLQPEMRLDHEPAHLEPLSFGCGKDYTRRSLYCCRAGRSACFEESHAAAVKHTVIATAHERQSRCRKTAWL